MPSVPQVREKGPHVAVIDGPMHQLVADQAIAVWSGRINGQQERQAILIDFVDAQDPGELGHDPGLVVLGKGAPACSRGTSGGSWLHSGTPRSRAPGAH